VAPQGSVAHPPLMTRLASSGAQLAQISMGDVSGGLLGSGALGHAKQPDASHQAPG
jgi:hypothetical protein